MEHDYIQSGCCLNCEKYTNWSEVCGSKGKTKFYSCSGLKKSVLECEECDLCPFFIPKSKVVESIGCIILDE